LFGPVMHQFSDSLANLRDFVDLVSPFLIQKDTEKIKQDAIHLAPLVLAINEILPEKSRIDDVIEANELQLLSDGVEIDVEEQEDGRKTVSIKGRLSPDFSRAMRGITHRHYQKELLYRSSLINLVSSAEWFLSRILHWYFDKFPEATENNEKFSLKDLKSLGSIEDAKAYLIDSVVENILRGSFEDWLGALRKKIELSMSYLEQHKDKLLEVCQRRNLLIHNGGIVNRIYLSKISSELKTGLSLGDQIQVTQQYLDDAIILSLNLSNVSF